MNRPNPDGKERARRAQELRVRQSEEQWQQTLSDIEANGGPLGRANRDRSAGLSTSFTKGLPHDDLGNVARGDFDSFVEAINAEPGTPHAANFNVPLGPKKGFVIKKFHGETEQKDTQVRGWESPRAGHVYSLQGADAGAVGMAPAPELGSEELIAEMAEVYALALLRDVGFDAIETGSANLVPGRSYSPQHVIDAVLSLKYFTETPAAGTAAERRLKGRRNAGGTLGAKEIFRGSGPKAKDGPYISQFMLIGNGGEDKAVSNGKIAYGSQLIDQKVACYNAGADFMVTWQTWLDVQNGADFRKAKHLAEAKTQRFLCHPRDLAAYVHDDALYQAYLNAALILLGAEHDFDAGLPEKNASGTRTGFATFGPPHLLALLTEVSSYALKAVRRQKFNVHTRCRPERIAAMITRFAAGKTHGWSAAETKAYQEMHEALDATGLLAWVQEANVKAQEHWEDKEPWLSTDASGVIAEGKNYLLPLAFPEGSPMHPSYGAGHATVAGACVTILKAFFEMFEGTGWQALPLKTATGHKAIYHADSSDCDTLAEVQVSQPLTLLGELDKLAANVSIGRNMAGVHFYSDYYDSVRMGERIAVQLLLDQMPTYGEEVEMRLISFDGDRITLRNSGGDAGMSLTNAQGNSVSPQNWRLRHLT